MEVSIVIPNWNGLKLLEKNLQILIGAKKNKKNRIKEIIIVDDKSTDGSVEFIKNVYAKEIDLVCHKQNRGFSSAVNTGFRQAKCELICLLNTDVLPEKDFLESVFPHFKSKKVFAVSLHERGYAYSTGKFLNGYIVHDPGLQKDKPCPTFWVSGGSGVFKREIWMKLGGFDEKIFSPFYWEDADLGYRALKRGYKLIWEPAANVIHKHESVINSGNFKRWRINLIKERNHLLFNWKNLTSENLLRKHRIGLIRRVLKHPGYLKVVLAALLKYPDIVKARKKELKEQVISDEAIFASFS